MPGKENDKRLIEKNKQLAVEFMEAFSRRDFDRYLSMLADDGTYEIMGDSVMSGRYSKTEFAEAVYGSVNIYPESIQFTIRELTAEGERVALEAWGSAKTADGRDYNNNYHLLFIIDDGKIREVREYLCTKLVNDVLAPAS